MNHADVDVVAPLVGEYYDWLIGKGGRSIQEILDATPLTAPQRRLLLDRCDDVLVCRGIVAGARQIVARSSRASSRQHHAPGPRD